MDKHRAHRSNQVLQWLTKNEKAIRVFYLPGYCPELNPDEFLNQDVKMHLGKKRAKNKAEMIKNLNSHLMMRQKQPEIIQNFIRGCHQGATPNTQPKKWELLFAPRNKFF